MLQLPALTILTVEPETVQTLEVVLAYETVRPDEAVAVRLTVPLDE